MSDDDDDPAASFEQPAKVSYVQRCPKGCAVGYVIRRADLLVWVVARKHYDHERNHFGRRLDEDPQSWTLTIQRLADDGATPVVLADRIAVEGEDAVLVAACARHGITIELRVRDLIERSTSPRSPRD